MIYVFKFSGCLALLLIFYHLVLAKERMYRFNRFFLLGSVCFALIAPLFLIYLPTVEPQPELVEMAHEVAGEVSLSITIATFISTNSAYFIIGYGLIGMVLFMRFSRNLMNILRKAKVHEKVGFQKAQVVLLHEDVLPHTFLNYIFINRKEFESQQVEDELLTHELAHISQRHTLDILFIELFQIVFWFNPLIVFLKKAIRLNHEFLADEATIITHKNIARYQQLLLARATLNPQSSLVSNINYSLTKKRFLMMTASKSKLAITWKKLIVLPILIGLGLLFANRVPLPASAVEEHTIEQRDGDKGVIGHHDSKDGDKEGHHPEGHDGDKHDKDMKERHGGKDGDKHDGDKEDHHPKGHDGDKHDKDMKERHGGKDGDKHDGDKEGHHPKGHDGDKHDKDMKERHGGKDGDKHDGDKEDHHPKGHDGDKHDKDKKEHHGGKDGDEGEHKKKKEKDNEHEG